jgi:ApaG protein
MPERPVELEGLSVTVDRVEFQDRFGNFPDRPYCFIYYITIHNDSEVPVTVRGRKWVVRSDDGEITAVEGDGVVGQTPLISPGETFSYNSFHMLRSRGATAEGAYLGVDDGGRVVLTRIPPFRMEVPASAGGD